MKLAAKLGAEPWKVSLPPTVSSIESLNNLFEFGKKINIMCLILQSWMICGYDTYHDAKQRKACYPDITHLRQ